MRTRSLSLLAVLTLAGLSIPAHAATPAPTPVELHIVATAQVPPDRATLSITINGMGETRAEAEADLAAAEATFRSELARLKVDPTKVQADDVESYEAEKAVVAVAVDAEGAVATPSTKRRSRAKPVMEDVPTRLSISKTFTIELDDISTLSQLDLRDGAELNYGRLRPVFSASDPAAARAKARELALAKARKDADETASAMGYRVVRMVRVSNARPLVNMQDLFDFVSMIDTRSNMMQPSYFTATAIETVAIDYLMVPK